MFSCHFWRTHFFKILLVIMLALLFMQYFANVFVYRQNAGKFVFPHLTWISDTLQKKLGIQEVNIAVSQDESFRRNASALASILTLQEAHNVVNMSKKNILLLNKTSTPVNSSSPDLPLCPLVPPKLVGRLKVLTEVMPFEKLELMFPELEPGGRFKPKECKARYKVALIIPYRDREQHLLIFLHNIHPMLQRQQLDYGIYIVEEAGTTQFNRAMLMNIGFVEALKQYDYDCFIFHDVDLIPEDDRNIYSCPEQPRHMSVAVNTMNYRLPYSDIFGGVSALSKDHMRLVNGFSNEFWGWGGEDDDMSNRIRFRKLKITRYSAKIARYTMLKHKKDKPNPDRYNKLNKGKFRYNSDGLSNLKYKRLDLLLKKLYTQVLVEISPIK